MKKRWFIAVFAVIIIFSAGMMVGAASSDPGSNADPLVTKSYVDQKLQDVEKESGYKSVTKGRKLVCDSGAMVIVISGKAKTTGAMSDVTDGISLASGKAVSINHNYLVTKNGTGVKASKSCKVFVMGGYSLK